MDYKVKHISQILSSNFDLRIFFWKIHQMSPKININWGKTAQRGISISHQFSLFWSLTKIPLQFIGRHFFFWCVKFRRGVALQTIILRTNFLYFFKKQRALFRQNRGQNLLKPKRTQNTNHRIGNLNAAAALNTCFHTKFMTPINTKKCRNTDLLDNGLVLN